MSAIKDLRDALAVDLAPLSVPVYTQWPIRLDPPCIFLTDPVTGPYITGGQELGSYVMSIDAVVMVPAAIVEDRGREDLETLLEALLRNTVDWAVTGVDPPSSAAFESDAHELLGAVAHLGKTFYL